MHDLTSPEHKADVTITVFPIAGRQLFFTIPERWCAECDLTVHVALSVANRYPGRVRVEVKPWLNHLVSALRRGGWHPPVVLVDGRRVSQGVVPNADALDAAILEALHRQERKGVSHGRGPAKT